MVPPKTQIQKPRVSRFLGNHRQLSDSFDTSTQRLPGRALPAEPHRSTTRHRYGTDRTPFANTVPRHRQESLDSGFSLLSTRQQVRYRDNFAMATAPDDDDGGVPVC
jgi:hypothetical protein